MPKRTIKQTQESCPSALPALPRGSPSASAASRREATVRKIVGEYADPLIELAKIMVTASDPKLKVECARALAPYLYPAMKAVEVSGPGGEQLVIEVRKVGEQAPVVPHVVPQGG